MSLGLMTPRHPKWQRFIKKLKGPGYCDFRGSGKDFRFNCDASRTCPKVRKALHALGANKQEIEQSIGFFAAMSGFCDCEIIWNVEAIFESQFGRTRQRNRATKIRRIRRCFNTNHPKKLIGQIKS